MDVYIYINRYLNDPLYQAVSFWNLGCDYIERVYTALQRTERDRLQGESVTTAYLTDTVLSIVHSLYGKEGSNYKSQPQVFLPGYTPPESEDVGRFNIDDNTIEIFMSEYQNNRIPAFAVMHLIELIPEWSQKVGSK